jgi:hypothetical protein
MAYNVIWSEEAESSFLLVIDDILFRWPAPKAVIICKLKDF